MRIAAALCALSLTTSPIAHADPDREVDTVVVRGEKIEVSGVRTISIDDTPASHPDSASLLDRVPGGSVNRNGPITGDLQIRGLAAERVGVSIDGQRFASGGPNRMDPPLHYAPGALIESLEVTRGLASVSQGPETVGGMVRARLQRSRFREGDQFQLESRGAISSRSANQSIEGGGVIALSNDRLRLHVLGATEHGDDFDAERGSIEPSEYRRNTIGAGFGVLLGRHELGFDYRRHDTDNAGTTALPLDIEFFETDLFQTRYRGEFGSWLVQAHASHARIDHEMDGFRQRTPPPAASAFRFSQAEATTTSYGLDARLPLFEGEFTIGFESRLARHDQDIFNPNAGAFFVRNFEDVERETTSGFAEWNAALTDQIELELGVRYAHVSMSAGTVDATPAQLMVPPMLLRDAFNAADRSQDEDMLDWVVKLTFAPTSRFRIELGGGRKMRAPSYIERYAWLPLEVTAGLADGNNYVGNMDLDPEVYHEIEGGFVWTTDRFYLAPRVFYRRADDFIQGAPSTSATVTMVSTANGDATPLQFSNIDAKMYGADVEWILQGPAGLELSGVASWVHARRRDITDALYRIAPLRGRSTLSWSSENWGAALEGVLVGRQGRVSQNNDETATGSYALANLSTWWEPSNDALRFEIGVENLFDRDYIDHLAGTKRTANGSIPIGSKLPGWGRNAYARVLWNF